MPIALIALIIIAVVFLAAIAGGLYLFAPQKIPDDAPKRIPVTPPDLKPLPAFDGQPAGLAPGIYCFGHIWHWDGNAWNHVSSPNIEPVTAISGANGNMWASCWEEVWRSSNGLEWKKVHGSHNRYFGAWTNGKTSYTVGSYGDILVFDEEGNCDDQSVDPVLFNAADGLGDEVWLAGNGGRILYSKGDGMWTEESAFTNNFQAISVSEAGSFIVGDEGFVAKRDENGEWKQELSTTTESFSGVWTDGEVAFAVTSSGSIFARKLGVWIKEHSANSQLTDVFAIDRNQVYVVGLGGTILWSDGNGEWVDLSGTRSMTINCIWGTGPNNLWVGGDQMYEINADGEGEGVEVIASATT